MATNLSGNTLTLGNYALTASQSGVTCIARMYFLEATSHISTNQPVGTFASLAPSNYSIALTGKNGQVSGLPSEDLVLVKE